MWFNWPSVKSGVLCLSHRVLVHEAVAALLSGTGTSGSEESPLQGQHGVWRESLLGLLELVLLPAQGPQHLHGVSFPRELLHSFLPEMREEESPRRQKIHQKLWCETPPPCKLTRGEEKGCTQTRPSASTALWVCRRRPSPECAKNRRLGQNNNTVVTASIRLVFCSPWPSSASL